MAALSSAGISSGREARSGGDVTMGISPNLRRVPTARHLRAAVIAVCMILTGCRMLTTNEGVGDEGVGDGGVGHTTLSGTAAGVGEHDAGEGNIPQGFDCQMGVLIEPDGSEHELCLWVALNDRQRQRGLMGVTELGRADGMAFVYPSDHSGGFWMKDTLLPLTIAFVNDEQIIDVESMVPCDADPCPITNADDAYDVAVEFTPDVADTLGVVTGGTLRLIDQPCQLGDDAGQGPASSGGDASSDA